MTSFPTTKKIVALIPCYNEGDSIADVITSFPKEKIKSQGYELEIIVIDNASTDDTAMIARELGVKVLTEQKKGKGNAMRLGFNSVPTDADYVVMLDGDGTYRPEEVLRLVEPLDSGFCDVVIGSRLGGRISEDSMTSLNRAGNWFFSHLVRYFYRINVTDVLTGYFAWKRDAVVALRPHLLSQGFAIEMEMVTKMAKLGAEPYCVPISYHKRSGDSNLRPFYDGSLILWMFFKNLFWKPYVPQPRRIAFVSDVVMPYHSGGKERRLYELSRRLVRKDREVHIYTMQWWNGPKTIQRDGVYYHAICKQHALYHNGRRSIRQALFFALAVFKLLFVRFDVLDVDQMPFFPLFTGRIVAWLRGKKMYATWHEVWGQDYWYTYLKGRSAFMAAVVEKISLKLPDVIIANSVHTAARLREAGVSCEVTTVSLGADLQSIYAAKPAAEQSDIIYVGRLIDHKNVDLLVRAVNILMPLYPAIKLLVVGNGPEKNNITNLVSTLGLEKNITLMNDVENDGALYGLLKSSKMLVLPSIREGFGLVVVEAHAAGIPVITTRHKDNAAKDLVVEGINGLLVNASADDIAEKIASIMAGRVVLQPTQGIEKYDWREVVRGLEHAFA